jgi:Sel1 repeat
VWPGHWDDKPKSGVWHATIDDSLVLPNIAARVERPTSQHFNLNGVWRSSNSAWLGGGVLATLRILQNGDRVQITAMDATTGFDTLRYDGRYQTGSIAGRLLEITNDADSAVTGEPAKPTWSDLSLRVDSADVITVPNGYVFRTSEPGPDDALCDSRNSSHVAPQYAYLRGRAAFRTSADYAKAACWFHAAAARGDGHSEAILALMFDQGYPGVPRSYAQALRWAKLSAAQGDYSGELALAMLYRNGHGTTADDRAADFWQSKAHKDYESDPDVRSAMMAQNMRTVGGMLLGALAAGVVLGASF